ncbi:hypothetical protein [Nocardia sp. Marseille-Q1738]
MTDEEDRAAAEIDVLTDVLTTVVSCTDGKGMTGAARVRVFALVIYELIASARTVPAPDTGRLYAAPILDPILDSVPAAEELTVLDLLIPVLVAQHDNPDPR